jgi:mono/diheme cytochrome c family protein
VTSWKKKSWLAAVVCTIAACGGGLPRPTPVDATRAQTRFPGTTVADLDRGRSLYVQTCAGCHALKAPGTLPPEQWKGEVDEMREKRGVAISDGDAELIVRYLWTASSDKRESAAR